MNEALYLEKLNMLWNKAWPLNIPRLPKYPKGKKPLSDYLKQWAEEQPDKLALCFYGNDITYSELDMLSTRFANVLISLGVKPGDRIAVYMPNCPQLHIAFYGILKSGAVYAPVSPLSKGMELQFQLNDCDTNIVICFDQLLPILLPVKELLGIEHVIMTSISELLPESPTIPLPELFQLAKIENDECLDFYTTVHAASSKTISHQPKLDDMAALNYTGGTTGLPKGCIHTHGDMLYTCASYVPVSLGTNPDMISLNFLPEFWIAGENSGLLFPVFNGTTMVLLARWDVDVFLHAIQHYRVTQCGLLVDSVDEILEYPQLYDFDISSLTATGCISFTKKLTADYRTRWQALTGCILHEFSYGMTETNTCDTFTLGFQSNNFDLSFSPTFVGLPVPGTEFKVCDFESGELVPLGSEGELCIRSPSLFKGYWGNEQSTTLNNNWFHTGDIGLITDAGFIRYLGRRKEMLKVNGMSVFPSELEAMLGQHPNILGSAVLGKEDTKRGQRVIAFVLLKPNSAETEPCLKKWCEERMAIYKVPDIIFVKELPMTATGKVKKQDLEKLL
ncbi:AMP-binding protein [Colwellia sp. E150_009]